MGNLIKATFSAAARRLFANRDRARPVVAQILAGADRIEAKDGTVLVRSRVVVAPTSPPITEAK